MLRSINVIEPKEMGPDFVFSQTTKKWSLSDECKANIVSSFQIPQDITSDIETLKVDQAGNATAITSLQNTVNTLSDEVASIDTTTPSIDPAVLADLRNQIDAIYTPGSSNVTLQNATYENSTLIYTGGTIQGNPAMTMVFPSSVASGGVMTMPTFAGGILYVAVISGSQLPMSMPALAITVGTNGIGVYDTSYVVASGTTVPLQWTDHSISVQIDGEWHTLSGATLSDPHVLFFEVSGGTLAPIQIAVDGLVSGSSSGGLLQQEIQARQLADAMLSDRIDNKASQYALSSLAQTVTDVQALAQSNQQGFAYKANQSDFDILQSTVTNQGITLAQKADQSALDALAIASSDHAAAALSSATAAANSANAASSSAAAAANTKTTIDGYMPAVQAASGGYRPFATLSALNSYAGGDKANFLAAVTNDTTTSNNGVYMWGGSSWSKSSYDPAQTAINDRKTLIDNSTQTDDGIYLFNSLRAALISLHTTSGMRIPGAGIDVTPTALAVSGLGLSVAGSKVAFGNVGLEVTEDGGSAVVVVGKFGQVLYDSRNGSSGTVSPTPTPTTTVATTTVTTTALQGLLSDLGNPLQSVVVTAIGDSICWGIGATGTATATPRNKTLADPRNNYSSSSYINLLRRWLGMMAGAQTGDPVELVPGTFNPANADPLKYSGFAGYRVPQFCNLDTRITKSTGCTVAVDTYALSGRALDIPVGGYASITVYGDSVDVLWKSQSADAASTFTLDCNGSGTQTVNTYNATLTHNNVVSATAPSFGTNTFKIVNTGTYPLRIQGIRHNRLIALRNNGLSGSSTATWLPTASPVILSDAVPTDTTHLLIKLGTNNRGTKGVTNLTDNLKTIIAWIQANRPSVKISLSAPPKAAPEYDFPGNPVYYFSTGTVRDAVYRVATEVGLSFVDFYAATASYELTAGSTTSYLDDGLHPNNTGYAEMFRTFTQAIVNA